MSDAEMPHNEPDTPAENDPNQMMIGDEPETPVEAPASPVEATSEPEAVATPEAPAEATEADVEAPYSCRVVAAKPPVEAPMEHPYTWKVVADDLLSGAFRDAHGQVDPCAVNKHLASCWAAEKPPIIAGILVWTE